MNNGGDSGIVCNLHAVGEWEEGVGSHHSTVEVEVEAVSFLYGLLESIYTRSLSDTACTELLVLGKDDGVALAVLHNLVGEEEIFDLSLVNGFFGDLLQLLRSLGVSVALLYKSTIESGAALESRTLKGLDNKDNAVLFLLEDSKSLIGISGGYAHLEEDFVHFLSRSSIDFAVCDKHSAESRHGVALKGSLPGIEHGVARSDSTSVVVLEDCKSSLSEVANKVHGSVDVEEVVVGNFLAVELGEHFIEVAEEIAFLVRILTIAHHLGTIDGQAECRRLFAIEVVEDVRVVGARYGKSLLGKPAAVFESGGGIAIGYETLIERFILSLRSDNNHIVEIFGSSADKRNAANIDFLDDISLGSTRSYGVLKWIEIDDNEVDFGNFVLSNLLAVTIVVATVENATKHLRVQGFHATAKDRRISGEVFNCITLIALFLDKRLCAPGREEAHTIVVEYLKNLV